MNAPTETILKKGYILIPKSMIEDFFKTGSQTEGYLEAWIQVLTRVNYSDTEVCVQGNRIVCGGVKPYIPTNSGKRHWDGADTAPAASSKRCSNPESWRW